MKDYEALVRALRGVDDMVSLYRCLRADDVSTSTCTGADGGGLPAPAPRPVLILLDLNRPAPMGATCWPCSRVRRTASYPCRGGDHGTTHAISRGAMRTGRTAIRSKAWTTRNSVRRYGCTWSTGCELSRRPANAEGR